MAVFANRRMQAAVIWALCAGAAVYLFFFEPGRTGIFPACPFHTLTGLNCPGCGTTRALHQLLHGHLLAAFKLNPLTMLLLPVPVVGLVLFTRSAITGQPFPRVSVPVRFAWLALFVVVGFWVFRNTSLYPFAS